MALTLSKITNRLRSIDGVPGWTRVAYRDVTLDASYVTGGSSLTPASVGLKVIFQVRPDGPAINAAGTACVVVKYNYATGKLQAFFTAAETAHTHTENTAATYTQNATTGASGSLAAAALTEVPAGTNLSAYTVRLAIEGTR